MSRRFDKSRRLRQRAEFQRVFDHGQRGRGRFLTIVIASRPEHGARLGLVASKKLGDAVRRNRAKRLIREIFRHNKPAETAGGVDIVVIPKRELFDATYTALEEDFRVVLARLAARLNQSKA